MDQYAGASTLNYPVKKIEASQVFFANRIYVFKTSVLLVIDYPFSMCRVFENFPFSLESTRYKRIRFSKARIRALEELRTQRKNCAEKLR